MGMCRYCASRVSTRNKFATRCAEGFHVGSFGADHGSGASPSWRRVAKLRRWRIWCQGQRLDFKLIRRIGQMYGYSGPRAIFWKKNARSLCRIGETSTTHVFSCPARRPETLFGLKPSKINPNEEKEYNTYSKGKKRKLQLRKKITNTTIIFLAKSHLVKYFWDKAISSEFVLSSLFR